MIALRKGALPTCRQAHHQRKLKDFPLPIIVTEHPRRMTRFHHGVPCQDMPWHGTRTKRTDHELPKPDTLTS